MLINQNLCHFQYFLNRKKFIFTGKNTKVTNLKKRSRQNKNIAKIELIEPIRTNRID